MPGYVGDEGTGDESLMVVGEAPGAQEDAAGRPFVGASGKLLERWMADARLQRSDAYWTNTYPFRPPGNKLHLIPPAELTEWKARLHETVAGHRGVRVVVAAGEVALSALLGLHGVVARRGSMYEYVDRNKRTLTVIPTIHPAAIFRTPAWEARCRRDWKRAADELTQPFLRLPQRELHIRPTLHDVEDAVAEARANADVMAIDIETPRELTLVPQGMTKAGKLKKPKRVKGARRITCVGFSWAPDAAICIPTTLSYWQDEERQKAAWRAVAELCSLPVEKAFHNGLFDTWWLERSGVKVSHWAWDTLSMHHALDAAEEHSLKFVASVYTRQPYWKDMADPKEGDDEAALWNESLNPEDFWRYNALDAAVTRELVDTLRVELEEAQLLPFYKQHYRQMQQPMLRLMRQGIRVNDEVRRRKLFKLKGQLVQLEAKLEAAAGESLVGKKGAQSSKKVQKFLYTTLQLPPVYKQTPNGKQAKAVTADEIAIRKLTMRFPKKLSEAGPWLLQHRRNQKLSEFLSPTMVSSDGKVHGGYKFTTVSGRLACGELPDGSGRNLQNIDHEARGIFVADEEMLFVECDLSQAESRVVDVLTEDAELIRLAQTMPWEFDVHRHNASLIFKVPAASITDDQRYLGKRAVHASNYGMRGGKLSEILLKEGRVHSADECTVMIESYMRSYPAIRRWQQRTRMTIMEDRELATSWGRRLRFTYARLGDDVYRDAYAFVPQSEVADLLNQWGLLPMMHEIRRRKWRTRVNAQIHDALLMSVPPEEAWDVMTFLRASLEVEREYGQMKVPLLIPCEFKIGRTWKGETKYKQFPTQAQLEQDVKALLQ